METHITNSKIIANKKISQQEKNAMLELSNNIPYLVKKIRKNKRNQLPIILFSIVVISTILWTLGIIYLIKMRYEK